MKIPIHFAANITMLFQEVPFLERFRRATEAGFSAVEFQFPYEYDIHDIEHMVEVYRLEIALFNLHPGDTKLKEWGTLGNPKRRGQFQWSFNKAMEIAEILGCARLNMMFGQKIDGLDPEEQIECAVRNLQWAAPKAAQANVTLLIEPLNAYDFPDYFLTTTRMALEIIRNVNHPSIGLQYDVYHAQMTEGNIVDTLTKFINEIKHIQIADVPGRHQPGTGEIRFQTIFSTLERLKYDGYVGLEYIPLTSTEESLSWIAEM
jgi:hydroxypyruvate isomerase